MELFGSLDADGEGRFYFWNTVAEPVGVYRLQLDFLPHHYLTATTTRLIDGTTEFSSVLESSVNSGEPEYLSIIAIDLKEDLSAPTVSADRNINVSLPNSRCLMLWFKYFLDRDSEDRGQLESQRQARIVFLGLDRIDRLTGYVR